MNHHHWVFLPILYKNNERNVTYHILIFLLSGTHIGADSKEVKGAVSHVWSSSLNCPICILLLLV